MQRMAAEHAGHLCEDLQHILGKNAIVAPLGRGRRLGSGDRSSVQRFQTATPCDPDGCWVAVAADRP